MKLMNRRQWLAGSSLAVGAWAVGAAAQEAAAPRTVEIVARRFVYEPSEITLKAGERVQVVVRSLDFVHGMNIPDLNQRYDLVPGRLTRFELNPQKPGVIEFVCDNFCGDGHEEMHGKFIVT